MAHSTPDFFCYVIYHCNVLLTKRKFIHANARKHWKIHNCTFGYSRIFFSVVVVGGKPHSRNTRKASVIFREKARVFTRAFFRVRSHPAKPSLWWPLETQRRNLYNSFTAPINFWRCLGIRMDHLRATYGVLNISLSPSSVRKTTCFLTIYESKCIATPKKIRKIWRK